jgi:pimeloyl-ACP methyl ester carboxylesterase
MEKRVGTGHLADPRGPGGWSGVWEKAAQRLAVAGYRVVAIDVPPLGCSERLAMPVCSRVDQARRIIGTLDALGVQCAVLLGRSFGARSCRSGAAMARSGRRFVPRRCRSQFGCPAQPTKPCRRCTGLVSPVRKLIAAATLSNPLFTKTLLNRCVAKSESVTPYWIAMY